MFFLSLALALALSRDDGTGLQAQRDVAREQSSVVHGANAPPVDRAARTPAGPRSLRQGTPLLIRTTTTLSTRTHEAGRFFTAHLDQSLVVDGLVIAPQGAELRGLVVDSDQGGRARGRASLAVQMTRLHIASGPTIAVSTSTCTVLANAGAGADTVLATQGNAAVIPADTVLQFTLNAPAALVQAR